MRFQLLGPLSISDGPHTVVLPPSKPTILLASLLLHSPAVVSVEYLQRAMWGEEQPATARAALQTCVLRLRRLFVKHGVTATPIEAVPGGYRISAGPAALDLVDFRERVRLAAGAAHDPDKELCMLRDALALWQGALLANVRSDVLQRDEVPRLAEERLRTVERVCGLQLALGRCGEALVELWSATRAHPGHERFREQLIEALYRSGRQSEALAEYRKVKEYLRSELGVDPSPALRELELAILRGDDLGRGDDVGGRGDAGRQQGSVVLRPVLAGAVLGRGEPTSRGEPTGRGELTAGPAADGRRTAVPPGGPSGAGGPARDVRADRDVQADGDVRAERAVPVLAAPEEPFVTAVPVVPSFTGRAAETAAAAARLVERSGAEPALVLVSGAPGIGKSALAQHVAHLLRDRFPGGRLLVRMVRRDGTPRTAAEVAAGITAVLRGSEGDGPVLLVLDDVVDADQARPLLHLRPDLAALVTSRMGLAGLIATHGGRVQRLGPLDEEESHRLLQATLGAERVAAEPRAARQLADACGHFPLALRIVTARLLTRPELSLAHCADWLADDPLAALSLPGSPQLSLGHVLASALGRIGPRPAEVFVRLGRLGREKFHAADCAAALGLSAGEAEDALERLADAGLLEEGPPGPYRMHDLLRVYARTSDPRRNSPTQKV
ncbi:BTAD domain-containing putative transcriptional regulator [Streptomyces sp. NPDC055709]